ncbi:beta-lactamase-like protein [Cadophora sp. MPI-SDFR-AT-0126]|nr:beta-lactamase-like protein [Leotiomycetes sp. MPI-SDFR-AT-0126]
MQTQQNGLRCDVGCLPLPRTDSYVKLRVLDGGSFIASTDVLHATGSKSETFRMHDWAFYIFHPSTGQNLLWDVGLSDDKNEYPPWSGKNLVDVLKPTRSRLSLRQQLLDIGVHHDDIRTVIFSHAHWDHCRPISKIFPNAIGLFGPGTFKHCSPGHFKDTNSQWHGNFFDPELKTESCVELEGPWQEFGPFEKAMDLFGDASFWIIQASGHMAGNLCAAARLETGDWVIMAGDCCHSRALLDGTQDYALWGGGVEKRSLHEDLSAAKDTVSRLRIAERNLSMHIVLAHDATWIEKGIDQALMSLINQEIVDSVRADL